MGSSQNLTDGSRHKSFDKSLILFEMQNMGPTGRKPQQRIPVNLQAIRALTGPASLGGQFAGGKPLTGKLL